jgi:Predicted membrane protein
MELIRKYKSGRIWELDFSRGIALLLMVYFHIIFDLVDLFNVKLSYTSGFNYFVGKISVILFIFISGISSTLSRNNLKRGAQVFAIAMLITIVTHLAGNDLGVKFGILHLLGLCMLLYGVLKRVNSKLLFISGILIIFTGIYFDHITMNNNYLFMFNLISNTFSSSDYYPLFPWMGIYLFGIVAGRLLYKDKRSLFSFNPRENPLLFAGRNTLVIYVVHQPLILLILTGAFKSFRIS